MQWNASFSWASLIDIICNECFETRQNMSTRKSFLRFDLGDRKDILDTAGFSSEYRAGRKARF